MPSPFDLLDAAAQAAMESLFGEGIRVEPMVVGNYGAAPDPARPARSTRAVVSRAPKIAATNYPSTNRKSADRVAVPTEVWIGAAERAALGYPIRRGDVIVLIDEPGSPRFAVAAIHATDHGDASFPLVSLAPEE